MLTKSNNTNQDLTNVMVSEQLQVVVSATFTIDYLLPSLSFLLEFAGLPANIEIAPYHQVFQQLLDSSSLSSQNDKGVNVFVIRLEDFVRDYVAQDEILGHLEKVTVELKEAICRFVLRASSPTIFALLPCSPRVSSELRLKLNTIKVTLENSLENLTGLVIISEADLSNASFSTDLGYDEISDDLAHVPFNEVSFAALALVIARKIHLLRIPARKVLVLDCDNTIWRGVVGEDGFDGITLPPALVQIQQFAVEAQSRGVLICLASKNAEQDVFDVFEKRTDMSLKFEHLVAHRINWESKYQNLQSLAGELNLGLDSFVFLDDNPVECGQIRQILPQVMTLQVPLDHEVSSFLNHLWAFDKLAITDEDVKRTQMYRENTTRQQMEDASTDIGAFLSSLELVIDIGQPDEEEWPRIAQLTQRTNQFNFTTVRRNESDIRALAATDSMLVQRVKVRDRFGDYGLVGLVISRHADDALVIDTLLLSCRVLGRGVEHAMLRNLGEIATGAGHDRIDLPYLQTQKNEPARAFADSVASTFRTGETDSVVYRIPVSAACKIMHTPGEDPEEVIEAKRSDGKKKPAKLATPEAGKSCSDRYEKLAGNLINGETVLAYIRTQHMRERSLATLKVDAETDIEGELLVLWQELLGVNGLGVEDDYFAIGGTSLLAARLFSEIAGRYGVRLRLTTILDAPTIRSLARYINPNQTAGTGVLVNLKSGHEKTLFLVHDGDGETLLYRNLAAHLPATVSVVGIEPYSILNIPMAHVSIDDIADFYVNAIRQRQPHGPYLLGGLCAGGLIAYVIATRLVRAGEEVKMVAILDAAVPGAVERIGQVTQERTNKLTAMLQSVQEMNMGTLQRWVYISNMLLKKITNALRWEIGSRYALLSTLLRFKVLKYVLANNKAWPSWIRELSVREIYVSAEAGCQLVSDANIKVLLVRASSGLEDDKPYREVYLDDTFGWRKIAPQLDVVDVDGGHASMLQEPNVVSLASIIKQYAILN